MDFPGLRGQPSIQKIGYAKMTVHTLCIKTSWKQSLNLTGVSFQNVVQFIHF